MRILTTLALIMAAQLAVAAAAPSPTKVGVIDMERALFLSDAAKSSVKNFEKANQTEVTKIKSLQDDLLKLKEKLEKEGDLLGEDERRKLANEHEQKLSEFKFYAQKLQQLEQKWKQELFQSQLPVMEKELKALIDEGGYEVVLQAGAVVYAAPSADLTKALIDRLNAKK